MLDSTELARLDRFLVADARDQFLVARALLRCTLSRYANVRCEQWAFGTNAHGKPFIRNPVAGTHLRFNLSHTAGLVACAVTRDHEIGIDVEHVHRNVDWTALGPKVLAPSELAFLRSAPVAEQRRHFFSFWTLKESYIKACGMGLAIPLDAFAFDLESATPRIAFSDRCPDAPDRWTFLQSDPTPEHRLALAVCGATDTGVATNVHWTVPIA